MKIKAKDGKLARVPGGLNVNLVEALMAGKEVEVDSIPAKLIDLVEVTKASPKLNDNKIKESKGSK